MNHPLMDSKEAALYLRISERTLRSLRQRGEIAFVRVGYGRGKIAYRQSDLDAYIESRVQQPRRQRRSRRRA